MKPCSNLSCRLYLSSLGDRLRCHRRAKGLSQAQLAIDADMEVSQISRIERGVINTSVVTLLQIATVLEMDISELLPTSPARRLMKLKTTESRRHPLPKPGNSLHHAGWAHPRAQK